jgi:hypothetical protein
MHRLFPGIAMRPVGAFRPGQLQRAAFMRASMKA